MKFETLTYDAPLTDFSVGGALGPQEALSSSPQGALSGALISAPLSAALLQFWMWMSLHLKAGLEVCSGMMTTVSQPSHIWQLPSTNPDTPQRAVRVNRSMMRKLRRLQRLYPPSYFDGPAYRPEGARPDLSSSQYLEYMIRLHRWSRVRTHGLGLRRHDMMLSAIACISLQGTAASLRKAELCNALLTPD